MKRCSRCGEEKSEDAFYREKGRLRANCKECHKKKIYAKRDEDREAFREYQREWNRKNPGKHAEYERARRERDWEKINARRREQRAADPEKYRKVQRAMWARKKEEIAAHRKRRRKENPEHAAAERDRNARGRARRSGAIVVTKVCEAEIIQRDLGLCGICGDPVMGPMHLDHIIPLAAGGTHEPDNVQIAHSTCNVRKQARLD